MAAALAAAEEMRGWTMRTAELEFTDDRQEERFRENSFQTARASVDPRQANLIGLLNGAAGSVLQGDGAFYCGMPLRYASCVLVWATLGLLWPMQQARATCML